MKHTEHLLVGPECMMGPNSLVAHAAKSLANAWSSDAVSCSNVHQPCCPTRRECRHKGRHNCQAKHEQERAQQVSAAATFSAWIEAVGQASVETTLFAVFLVQVGLYLSGQFLCRLISVAAHGHLKKLGADCPEGLWQRFLTHVINEKDNAIHSDEIRFELTKYWKMYRSEMKNQEFVDHRLYRLGLVDHLSPDMLNHRFQLLCYYFYLQRDSASRPNYTLFLPLVHPLPKLLQIDDSCLTASSRQGFLALHNNILLIELKLREAAVTHTTPDRCELSVLALREQRIQELHQWSASARHITLLRAMARSVFVGAPHLTVVLGFMALLEPFYSIGTPCLTDGPDGRILKRFKCDIYWFLATALSILYAQLDLPLACLAMARQCLKGCAFDAMSSAAPGIDSFGDEIRHALVTQNVLVLYGHYDNANVLFEQWFRHLPLTSSLYAEFFMIHVKGVFWQTEDTLVELWLTNLYHDTYCDLFCYAEYVEGHLLKARKALDSLARLVHQGLAKSSLSYGLQSELNVVLQLCEVYQHTLTCILSRNRGHYAYLLRLLWEKIQWDQYPDMSPHLAPFMAILPYSTASPFFWKVLITRTLEDDKEKYAKQSFLKVARIHADQTFTLMTSLLINAEHNGEVDVVPVIEAALESYKTCTGHRHHRVTLLTHLLHVFTHQNDYQLSNPEETSNLPWFTWNPWKRTEHKNEPDDRKSAVGMTQTAIHEFACNAMVDAAPDHVVWRNDEMLCSYLRQQDERMPAWIHAGLITFQCAGLMNFI